MKKPKILLIYLTILILIFSILFIVTNYDNNKERIIFKENQIEGLQLSYDLLINSFKRSSKIIFQEIINKPEIWEIMEKGNSDDSKIKNRARDELLLKLGETYVNLQKMNVRQLHFHLPDNTSFLRFHKVNKYGDSLTSTRYSVRKVNEELIETHGFEEGKICNGFRYVFPIITSENKHLGSVEISVSFKAVKKELNRILPREFIFVLDKSLVMEKLFVPELVNYKICDLSEDFLSEIDCEMSFAVSQLNILIKPDVKEKMKKFEKFVITKKYENTHYVVTFLPISNVEGINKAYIISYDKSEILYLIKNKFEVSIILFIVLFLVIGYFIILLDQKRKRILEEESKYKLMINEINDPIFIVQKGKMIYFNSMFSNLLGFKNNELMNKEIKEIVCKYVYNYNLYDLVDDKISNKLNYHTQLLNSYGDKIDVEISESTLMINNMLARFAVVRDRTKVSKLLHKITIGEKQVTALDDFISICANCHQIKDEENNVIHWVDPEIYITERLPNIRFSHSICPKCIKELYPQIDSSTQK